MPRDPGLNTVTTQPSNAGEIVAVSAPYDALANPSNDDLIGAGLPPSALRIAWVKTRQGEQHAVLVVKTTDHRDLVLDNLTGQIRTLPQTGYTVLGISGPDPKVWS